MSRFLTWFRSRRRSGTVAGVLVLFLVLVAVFAPLLAPHDPKAGDVLEAVQPPAWSDGGSSDHLLGTDRLGRDILSRGIYGARTSLSLAVGGVVIGLLLGGAAGLLAGYRSGWVDAVIMRLADASLSLPLILVALAFAIVLGPGTSTVLAVMALVLWGRFCRQARGEAIRLRERDYVASARISGVSSARILARHILPGAVDSLVVLSTLQLAGMVMLESSLSFLGVGLPPETPAWGVMVSDGLSQLVIGEWWPAVIPAIALAVTVLSINMAGDWLRDALDPHLRDL